MSIKTFCDKCGRVTVNPIPLNFFDKEYGQYCIRIEKPYYITGLRDGDLCLECIRELIDNNVSEEREKLSPKEISQTQESHARDIETPAFLRKIMD